MKKVTNINNNTEYLSKDILDEEFIKTFSFIYNIQLIMGSSRVYVKDRFVTTPPLLQKIYTVVSIILLLYLDYIIVQKLAIIYSENDTVYYLSVCITGLQALTNICNLINVRFINSDMNIDFFVKLQQIDRAMKVDHNVTLNTLIIRTNCFFLGLVLINFGAFLVLASAEGNVLWPYVGIAYSQLSFGIELINCSNIITSFFTRICFLNSIVKNYIDKKKTQQFLYSNARVPFSVLFASKTFMRRLAAESHNFVSSETDVYLKEILEGFSKLQEIYRFQVFMFCCKLVISCLITFEFLLFAVKNEALGIWDSVTPSYFTIIDLILALILGIRCEVFLREAKETKRLSVAIMARHFEGRLRDKANRMLKMLEETPPRFSVYDMWLLDANILLQMFMLVTSLVVTQLQFAYM